jgi:hypothetical protein
MDVCRCECCLLSCRGLCDELITRPEEFYRQWCVVVCDLETSWMRPSRFIIGYRPRIFCFVLFCFWTAQLRPTLLHFWGL